jgi:FtsZ-interacting cell division protein ZipA
MRRRVGRRRTVGGSTVVLGLGALAVIALIIRWRAAANTTGESYSTADERFDETHASSREVTEGVQERRREEPAGVLTQDTVKTDRSIRDDIRSIIRESVSRSEVVDRAASQARTPAPEAQTDAEGLPIEDYDSLNVRQIAERLDGLVVEEIERVLDYETKNKNRRTLIARLERRAKKSPGEDVKILRKFAGGREAEL